MCPQACQRITPPPLHLHDTHTSTHTSTHRTSRQLSIVPASLGWGGHSGCPARQAAGTCSSAACGDRQWQSWCKRVHVRGRRQENTTQHMFLVGFASRTLEVISGDLCDTFGCCYDIVTNRNTNFNAVSAESRDGA